MATYYHVVNGTWKPGDPLLCWDKLQANDISTPWKWEDAPEGYDGGVVCLFADRGEAENFRSEYGGTLLIITVPDDDTDDLGSYPLPWNGSGYITPRLTQVDEGFPAITDGIPAEWITLDTTTEEAG